jgi:HD superfamily phosphodiesterase
MSDLSRYDPVWRVTEPYMRARKNDVHIPLSFDWCQRLLDIHPEADVDICSLAILLHDIGWYSIDQEAIIEQGFRSENFLQSDVRYLHETEGVRLGTEVLKQTGWSEEVIKAVCEIIDGHDTRPDPHHMNDRIVRDADKLWRYDVPGIAIASDWFGQTPHGYAEHLEKDLDKLETEAGRKMAIETLALSRAALKLHVL